MLSLADVVSLLEHGVTADAEVAGERPRRARRPPVRRRQAAPGSAVGPDRIRKLFLGFHRGAICAIARLDLGFVESASRGRLSREATPMGLTAVPARLPRRTRFLYGRAVSEVPTPLLVLAGLALLLVAGGSAGYLMRSLYRSTETAVRFAGVAVDAARQAQTAATPTQRQAVLIPDYIDRPLLEDIARQKGLQVDTERWEHGTEESEGKERASEGGVTGGVPGVFGGEARVIATETTGRSRYRARGADRSPDTRRVVTELLAALEADGELRRDLADVPADAEFAASFFQLLLASHFEWGLATLDEDDPRRDLLDASDTLLGEAIQQIEDAKDAELQEVVPGRREVRFALVESEWDVQEDDGEPVLVCGWLVERENGQPDLAVYGAAFLEVPLDASKIVASGRRRFTAGATPWLTVFGKIERFEEGRLELLPIVIWA